jgi:hypothetical protein
MANTTKAEIRKDFWELVGAYCRNCGYDRALRSLHCHHIEPAQKVSHKDNLSQKMGNEKTLKDYCRRNRFIVLCANCHGEVHDGLLKIPSDYMGDNLLYATAVPIRAYKIVLGILERQNNDGIDRNTHKNRLSIK